MKNSNKHILVKDLPSCIGAALKEHINNILGLEMIEKTEEGIKASVVITASLNRESFSIPRISISLEEKIRMGELLLKLYQMLKQPWFYVESIKLRGLVFKPKDKIIENTHGKEISLTDREIDLLYYMSQKAGEVINKERLLQDIWNYKNELDTHTLETHIYRLRQKLDEAGESRILTTQESGYLLDLKNENY